MSDLYNEDDKKETEQRDFREVNDFREVTDSRETSDFREVFPEENAGDHIKDSTEKSISLIFSFIELYNSFPLSVSFKPSLSL